MSYLTLYNYKWFENHYLAGHHHLCDRKEMLRNYLVVNSRVLYAKDTTARDQLIFPTTITGTYHNQKLKLTITL